MIIGTVGDVGIRGGGKGTAMSWNGGVDNVGNISYFTGQVFEHAHNVQFRSFTHQMAALQLPTFAHLARDSLLLRLPGNHQLIQVGRYLEIDRNALQIFNEFQDPDVITKLGSAVKALVKARKQTNSRNRKAAAEGRNERFSDVEE